MTTPIADHFADIAAELKRIQAEEKPDPSLWETEDNMQRADEPAEQISADEMLALLDALSCA